MNDMFRPWSQPADRSKLRDLRPYQGSAIAQIREAILDGHKRIVLQIPTGGGKTLVASHIIHGALEKGRRPIFLAPAINLVNQTLAAFEREGIFDIGVQQAQHERTDWDAACQIASVQTFIRRREWPSDLVIIDEAHQTFEALNRRLESPEWAEKIVIGLSATPWAKGMGLRWTKLIIAATTESLMDEGYLCPFEVFAPAEDVDLSGVKTVAGDYHEGQLSEVMSAPTLVADVVKTWIERGGNQPTFLFGVDRAHAAAMQEEFRQAGVSCSYIDGFSTPEERFEIFRRFRNGDDLIISSVGCLTTGIDEDCRVLIDAAPTRSEIRHVQKLGRCLRLAEGKRIATILDHAGNCLRLGLPTDIHHDRLNTRKPGERDEPEAAEKPTPKPRKCKACGCVMPPASKACPACGEVPVKLSGVQVEDGELVLMGSGQKGKPAAKGDKQALYSGLLQIAAERGYAQGWAAHAFRARHGAFPSGLHKKPCSNLEARNWASHLMIKRAKSYGK
jgi:superfamily II DNA or RNA helicase